MRQTTQVDHLTGCVKCGRKQFTYSYWREDGAPLCNLCGREMADADEYARRGNE